MTLNVCKLCQNPISTSDQICIDCSNTILFLEDIINDYFSSTPDPRYLNALREFSWIYSGYLRLIGHFNTLVEIMYYFFADPTQNTVSRTDLKDFNFTKIPPDQIEAVAIDARVIKKAPSDPNSFIIGDLTDRIRKQIFLNPTVRLASSQTKDLLEQAFGILSIVLTKALINKILNSPLKADINPRKAVAVFLIFVKTVKDNPSGTIPTYFNLSLIDDTLTTLGFDPRSKVRFMLQLFGFIPQRPGEPNIIADFDPSSNRGQFKNNIINMIELLRNRTRTRFRIR